MGRIAMGFGLIFYARITNAMPPQVPNDMVVPNTDFSDIVVGMADHNRVLIGMLAMEVYKKYWSVRLTTSSVIYEGLEDEIRAGQCTLMLNRSGEAMRVVALGAMYLRDAVGRIFVQLGRYDS